MAELEIGWTTTASREDAEKLARSCIDQGLAACIQIDGPITSFYRWQGQTEQEEEFRLTVKFVAEKGPALEQWLLANHPYQIPQWLTVKASHVLPAYLSWAES